MPQKLVFTTPSSSHNTQRSQNKPVWQRFPLGMIILSSRMFSLPDGLCLPMTLILGQATVIGWSKVLPILLPLPFRHTHPKTVSTAHPECSIDYRLNRSSSVTWLAMMEFSPVFTPCGVIIVICNVFFVPVIAPNDSIFRTSVSSMSLVML